MKLRYATLKHYCMGMSGHLGNNTNQDWTQWHLLSGLDSLPNVLLAKNSFYRDQSCHQMFYLSRVHINSQYHQ